MKSSILNRIKKTGWILPIAVLLTVGACKKNNYLGYTPGSGAPTVSSVHTLGKTDTIARYDTVYTYDASGNVTKTLRQIGNIIVPFDSVTTAGNLGNYYIIKGTNLGEASSVTFNGTAGFLNRAWNTDNSIIISVPGDAPATGTQATNSLIVTTVHGSVTYKFTIIPPPPTVSSLSDYNFWAGSRITLTGVGFASVTKVALSGVTDVVTIVSQTDKQMVLQFPTTTANRANLVYTYGTASNPQTLTSTQEFVDLDNSYNLFAFGQFKNGFGDWSWTHPASGNPATGPTHSYGQTQSFELVFPKGGWQMEGFGSGSASNQAIFSTYKYYTFWIYGGTQSETVTLSANQLPYGWAQPTGAGIFTITVPPNVWTYFKIPIGSGGGQLPLLAAAAAQTSMTAAGNNLVSWFIPGPNGVDETMYVDEVAFIK
jgi:hypothetical protein